MRPEVTSLRIGGGELVARHAAALQMEIACDLQAALCHEACNHRLRHGPLFSRLEGILGSAADSGSDGSRCVALAPRVISAQHGQDGSFD